MFPDVLLSRTKRPNEEFRLAWDFQNDLESGDSISAYEVKAFDASDNSDQTSTMIQGPSQSGTIIKAQVQAGTDAHDYWVRFEATSSQGDKWQRVVRLMVRV